MLFGFFAPIAPPKCQLNRMKIVKTDCGDSTTNIWANATKPSESSLKHVNNFPTIVVIVAVFVA